MEKWFLQMVKILDLGELCAKPERVSGGYMHKMFRIETSKGKYAVKVLNPIIMKRPGVFDNYKRAEFLEKILQENDLPIIPALEINKKKMQCVEGTYFYVFAWSEGKVIPWQEITLEHCKIIGELLAKIHKIGKTGEKGRAGEADQVEKKGIVDQVEEYCEACAFCVDWAEYAKQAEEKCPEIAKLLQEKEGLLQEAQETYNAAVKNVPSVTCICNGDMDSKNVLWLNKCPQIIDLECLDYGNPFVEMFQLALSWAGGVVNNLDYGCLGSFIISYKKEYGEINVDLSALYGLGFSWLDWLDYNVRRAFGIECEDEEERQMGISQVKETMERIVYYSSIKNELVEVMDKL